eukprot:scaffold175617_cov35-Tisochrysis_lutea.AAC.3
MELSSQPALLPPTRPLKRCRWCTAHGMMVRLDTRGRAQTGRCQSLLAMTRYPDIRWHTYARVRRPSPGVAACSGLDVASGPRLRARAYGHNSLEYARRQTEPAQAPRSEQSSMLPVRSLHRYRRAHHLCRRGANRPPDCHAAPPPTLPPPISPPSERVAAMNSYSPLVTPHLAIYHYCIVRTLYLFPLV